MNVQDSVFYNGLSTSKHQRSFLHKIAIVKYRSILGVWLFTLDLVLLFFAVPNIVYAEDPSTPCKNTNQTVKVAPTTTNEKGKALENGTNALNNDGKKPETENDVLSDLVDSYATNPVLKAAVQIARSIRDETRKGQDAVYEFVRRINKNIEQLPKDGYGCFKTIVFNTTNELRKASYDDRLFNNKNLSRLIQNRLSTIIDESVIIVGKYQSCKLKGQDPNCLPDDQELADFSQDLKIISKKFLYAKRFQLAIGAVFSYLPKVTYTAYGQVDFSPFVRNDALPPFPERYHSLTLHGTFVDKAYPGIIVTAKIPYIYIDISIPHYKAEKTFDAPVHVANINGVNGTLLDRYTVKSTLELQYDARIAISIRDIVSIFSHYLDGSPYDLALGVGMTGMKVTNTVAADIRIATAPDQTFNDLASTGNIVTTDSVAGKAVYLDLNGKVDVGGEWTIWLDIRNYNNQWGQSHTVNIDGLSISLGGSWYFR